LVIIYLAYGIYEYRRHIFNIKRIPVRVHINGTRGKSSVTRLIGGGLKGGGKRVFIKTTGTSPRTIGITDYEQPIRRVGSANIIEQLKIARDAAADRAEFFVVECMALLPNLQDITEHQMIKSQTGVITNIREDHLDVMGPTVNDVAEALCNTIPEKGVLFTTERRYIDTIRKRARNLKTEVIAVESDDISPDDLAGFNYLEHRDNVALALAVCRHFGIEKQAALQGMSAIRPDPGALRKYGLSINRHSVEFVNAFAANDPESYMAIWEMLHLHKGDSKQLIVLVNSRRDRVQRAEQLGELIATKLEADYFIISGEATRPLVHLALKNGLNQSLIKDLGGQSVVEITEFLSSFIKQDTIIVGIGNIVGLGEEIVQFFANKGRMVA
jgi:poly-gamma-glutamate synthase PgsB/CapB